MNQQIDGCGAVRRERIAKADRAVARASALAAVWQPGSKFSHYMTSCEYCVELHAAQLLYEAAGLAVMAEKIRKLRDPKHSSDLPAAWREFRKK